MKKNRQPTRQERWASRNPMAKWAHSATQSALRRGLIKPRQCENCGAEKTEAHHPDYRRPLYVVWLCRACHKKLHAAQNRGESFVIWCTSERQ